MSVQHVLIVGGGLAGPCLALSLAKHNIRSTIYEIRPTRQDIGGSISLGPSALRVLDRYAGVLTKLQATGFTYRQFGAYTSEGEKLGDIMIGDDPEKGDDGYPALRIMRSDLHKTLLEAAKDTKKVEIKWGMRLTRIEEGQGVVAHFEDGSRAEGDILIGADGIHSKVREHVLGPESPKAKHDGIAIVTGFVPTDSVVKPSKDFEFPCFVFTPSGMLMNIPYVPDGSRLAWGINKPMADRSRHEWQELSDSGEAFRLAKQDYDNVQTQPIRSLLDNADGSRLWAPYSIPALPKWHTSKVCLIGDAAHGMPPNGLGSALAFEDGAIMTRLLTSSTIELADVFDRFEAIRKPRIEKLRASQGKAVKAVKQESGPWAWWGKKIAFRLYFWWNRGMLQHNHETNYNVDEAVL